MHALIRLVGDRQGLVHSVHLPMNQHCERGEHRKNSNGFVHSTYSKSFFFQQRSYNFRFLSKIQSNHHDLKVLCDLTQNSKSCRIFVIYFYIHFQWQASPLSQREINQNSQVDRSQCRIDVYRRNVDQANRH